MGATNFFSGFFCLPRTFQLANCLQSAGKTFSCGTLVFIKSTRGKIQPLGPIVTRPRHCCICFGTLRCWDMRGPLDTLRILIAFMGTMGSNLQKVLPFIDWPPWEKLEIGCLYVRVRNDTKRFIKETIKSSETKKK